MNEADKLDLILENLSQIDKRTAIMETILTGVRGEGGVLADIHRIAQSVAVQGTEIGRIEKETAKALNGVISSLATNTTNVTHFGKTVDEHKGKITTLFKLTNTDRILAAGISTKVAMLVTFIIAASALGFNFMTKAP